MGQEKVIITINQKYRAMTIIVDPSKRCKESNCYSLLLNQVPTVGDFKSTVGCVVPPRTAPRIALLLLQVMVALSLLVDGANLIRYLKNKIYKTIALFFCSS